MSVVAPRTYQTGLAVWCWSSNHMLGTTAITTVCRATVLRARVGRSVQTTCDKRQPWTVVAFQLSIRLKNDRTLECPLIGRETQWLPYCVHLLVQNSSIVNDWHCIRFCRVKCTKMLIKWSRSACYVQDKTTLLVYEDTGTQKLLVCEIWAFHNFDKHIQSDVSNFIFNSWEILKLLSWMHYVPLKRWVLLTPRNRVTALKIRILKCIEGFRFP
jgi:hypothetical protein